MKTTTQEQDIFITTVLKNWDLQVTRGKALIDSLSEEDIMKEVAPGKNRGIYIVGHLIAYHDLLGEILGYGDRQHPHLQPIFIEAADKSDVILPSYAELKVLYEDVQAYRRTTQRDTGSTMAPKTRSNKRRGF